VSAKKNVKSSLQRRSNPNRTMQHAAPQRAPTQTPKQRHSAMQNQAPAKNYEATRYRTRSNPEQQAHASPQ